MHTTTTTITKTNPKHNEPSLRSRKFWRNIYGSGDLKTVGNIFRLREGAQLFVSVCVYSFESWCFGSHTLHLCVCVYGCV